MTIPVPMSTLPTCTLWIDGVRFADGSTPGETDDTPVALTDLKVVWGRDNTLDQPEPGTCSFTVLDVQGGARFGNMLRIGSKVQVRADATIYPDPTVPIFTFDAGFEGMTVGAVPPSTTANCTFTVSTGGPPHAGTRSALMDPTPGAGGMMSVVIPPAAYGDASAWDAIPRALAGQTWHWGLSVLATNLLTANQAVKVRPVVFTAPNAAAAAPLYDRTVTVPIGATGWQTVLEEIVPPEGCWLGLMVEVRPAGGTTWDELDPYLTWDALGGSTAWDDIGRVFVDDLKLLAPAAGALRSGTVFTGRITDLRAQYDQGVGGTVVDVTAQTHLAELNNRYVGDQPWLKETLAQRFSNIVTASGQAVTYQIDSSVQGRQISWRDVDAQPAGDLLHELAQSVGGALWSAATSTGDAYVWLEDIGNRPAMYALTRDPDGVIRIHLNAALIAGDRAITIDACDVLLEPVQWQQTSEDDSTRVVVQWKEQTLDQDGNQRPTNRDYIATDTTAELATGRRRVQVSTELALEADAELLSQALLARLSTPGWRVSGLTWDMSQVDVVDADTLTRVMTVLDGVARLGLGILLTNVPTWAPPGDGSDIWLFLEGGTLINHDGAWTLEMLTSRGEAQGEATVRWDDLPGGTLLRTNRGTNPRAVTGGTAQWGQAGWGTGGNGTTSYITGVTAPTGTNISTAFRKTWTVAATSVQSAALALTGDASNRIPATAGKTYTISVWVRHSGLGAAKNYEILLRWFNQVATSGGAQVGTDQIGSAVAVSDGVAWTRLSITVTAPAGTLAMLVYPRVQAAATGAIAINSTQDATGLLIEEAAGPAGVYFDGDSADTAGVIDNAWAGTTNASTSTQTDMTTGWQWDQFDPAITWNDLHGVSV